MVQPEHRLAARADLPVKPRQAPDLRRSAGVSPDGSHGVGQRGVPSAARQLGTDYLRLLQPHPRDDGVPTQDSGSPLTEQIVPPQLPRRGGLTGGELPKLGRGGGPFRRPHRPRRGHAGPPPALARPAGGGIHLQVAPPPLHRLLGRSDPLERSGRVIARRRVRRLILQRAFRGLEGLEQVAAGAGDPRASQVRGGQVGQDRSGRVREP